MLRLKVPRLRNFIKRYLQDDHLLGKITVLRNRLFAGTRNVLFCFSLQLLTNSKQSRQIQWNPDITKLYRYIEIPDVTIWPLNNRKYRYIGVNLTYTFYWIKRL